MLTPDSIVTAFMEAQALLQHARPDQLHELARLLACEVAYCRRYGETLPIGELVQRIEAANRDPASAALVTDGLGHLSEVLRLLHVTPAQSDLVDSLSAKRDR